MTEKLTKTDLDKKLKADLVDFAYDQQDAILDLQETVGKLSDQLDAVKSAPAPAPAAPDFCPRALAAMKQLAAAGGVSFEDAIEGALLLASLQVRKFGAPATARKLKDALAALR